MKLGTKWDLGQRRLSLRSALFRTNKYNAREPDPDNPLLDVLAGNQRVDGIEFQAQGHLTSRWELLSSFAYLDSKVVSSQYYPAAVGISAGECARNTLSTSGASIVSPSAGRLGPAATTCPAARPAPRRRSIPSTGLIKEVPGYWVFNAMVKHPLNEHLDLQVNVNNIANRYYYDELHPGHIVLGPGRSALIGLKFKF